MEILNGTQVAFETKERLRKDIEESYHSHFGALTETNTIYIDYGYNYFYYHGYCSNNVFNSSFIKTKSKHKILLIFKLS